MDDGGPTASIILFAVLLLIDVFFYGFSAALNALNEKEIGRRAEEDKDKKSLRLRKMLDNPTDFVNTFQLVTMLVNVTIGAVHLGIVLRSVQRGLAALARRQADAELLPQALVVTAAVLSTLLLLYITLTLGVLLPGKIAVRIPERWAYACVNPVFFVTRILSPFTAAASVTSNAILRLFGVKVSAGAEDVTEEEIISMINEGHEQGVLEASEAEMITNIFEFDDKEAADIMTHRKNVVALDGEMSLKDAVDFIIKESGNGGGHAGRDQQPLSGL